MTIPLFSVIIPTRGRPEMLREAVASVLAQSVDDLECIVVDDGGSDVPARWTDPRVRIVVRDRNGGPAAARNTGLIAATGKYVAFLDDDDTFTPERLAMGLEGLGHAPIALCWNRFDDQEPRPQRFLNGYVRNSILNTTTPHLGVTAVDRETMLPFDESYPAAEDVEWWLRMAAVAPVVTVPAFGLTIRRHTGPRLGTGLRERIDGSLSMMRNHAEYFQGHPAAAAFRWKRIGMMARAAGDRRLARRAFGRALRIRPEAGTLAHLARAAVR